MSENRLSYSEILRVYGIEEQFLIALQESGLIEIEKENENKFIQYDSLKYFEQFVRWHYDLNINIEGIEALHHLVKRMQTLQEKVKQMELELRFYKSFRTDKVE